MKNKIKLIRKTKYYFFKYGLHRLFPSNKLSFISHLSSLSKWISNNRKLKFTSFPSKTFNYQNRFNLYKFVIENEISNEAIDYFEFGVSKGVSFKWWIEQIKSKDASFYGFDTFDGLPENWGAFKKGDMSNGNAPPEINDNRHKFFQGIFQDTLYKFLKNYQSDKQKVILLDADLYSSTLFVLTTLSPYLNKGDVLIFDEFNVPLHEYKAFSEWVSSFYIDYTVIGEINNYYQVAIRLN